MMHKPLSFMWKTGLEQNMQFNADKCKVMVIDLKKQKHSFRPLLVNEKELKKVDHTKILGLTISSNLKWNNDIYKSIKKVNTHLYFLVLLKMASVSPDGTVRFYCTTVRPVL